MTEQSDETPEELMKQIRLHMYACHKAIKKLFPVGEREKNKEKEKEREKEKENQKEKEREKDKEKKKEREGREEFEKGNPTSHSHKLSEQEREEAKKRWNCLADKYNLHRIYSGGPTRARALAMRIEENLFFWDAVEFKLASRGPWARRKRFPTFDQVLTPSTLQKLLEGNYDALPGESGIEDDRRAELVDLIKNHIGQSVGSSVVISTGLSGMHTDISWNNLSLEELEKAHNVLEGNGGVEEGLTKPVDSREDSPGDGLRVHQNPRD